jgi:hypothetical protein
MVQKGSCFHKMVTETLSLISSHFSSPTSVRTGGLGNTRLLSDLIFYSCSPQTMSHSTDSMWGWQMTWDSPGSATIQIGQGEGTSKVSLSKAGISQQLVPYRPEVLRGSLCVSVHVCTCVHACVTGVCVHVGTHTSVCNVCVCAYTHLLGVWCICAHTCACSVCVCIFA